MNRRLRNFTPAIALLPCIFVGCISMRSPTPHTLDTLSEESYRSQTVELAAGYQDGNGVPTVAARFKDRPGLKVAIIQLGSYIQGDMPREFKDITNFNMMANAYDPKGIGRSEHITAVYQSVGGVKIPALVGLHIATSSAKTLEAKLKEVGFDVISYEDVAETDAYKGTYGEWPPFAVVEEGDFALTSMAAGWAGFAPKGMHIEPPSGVIALHTPGLWPKDSVFMKALRQELGHDVLFLAIQQRLSTHKIQGGAGSRDRVGQFGAEIALQVVDPELAGTGFGFGHIATLLTITIQPSPRADFMKKEGNGWAINWQLLTEDADLITNYSYESMAQLLWQRAHPPEGG